MTCSGALHHIEFYVNDFEQSSQFWSWLLKRYGYKLANSWNMGQSWQLQNGTYFVLVQVKPQWLNIKNNRQGQGFNHFAFWSLPDENLESLAHELAEHGAKILLLNDKHVCFEAVDGIVAEIYFHSEAATK